MKKPLVIATLAVLMATQIFAASYWVVMKGGMRYEAKSKWTVVNGKAVIALVNGNLLSVDPNAIDVAKSEEVTRLGGGSLISAEQAPVVTTSKESTLGVVNPSHSWSCCSAPTPRSIRPTAQRRGRAGPIGRARSSSPGAGGGRCNAGSDVARHGRRRGGRSQAGMRGSTRHPLASPMYANDVPAVARRETAPEATRDA